jgi:hypothetical protein
MPYKSNFSMPIIASNPPSGTVTAASVGRYLLRIEVSNQADAQLFSMAGGALWYVPADRDPFFLYDIYPELALLEPPRESRRLVDTSYATNAGHSSEA